MHKSKFFWEMENVIIFLMFLDVQEIPLSY